MQTLTDLLLGFKGRQNLPALILIKQNGSRQSFSYGWLYRESLDFAFVLKKLGLRPKDRVALLCTESLPWSVAFWGIQALGGVAVCLDRKQIYRQSEQLAGMARAKIIIHDMQNLPKPSADIPAFSFYKLVNLKTPAPADFVPHKCLPGDLAEITFTSGTTGEPRAVALTHKNIASNLTQVNAGVPYISQNSKFLNSLHLYNIFTQTAGFLTPLYKGASIVFPEDLSPKSLLELWLKEKVSVVITAPWLLGNLQNYIGEHGLAGWIKELVKKRGKHFQFFISGGYALPEHFRDFWQGLGLPVLQGYGLTECSPVLAVTGINEADPHTVGKALPGVLLKIRRGEILAKGPNVFSGYLNNPKATAAAFTKDGFFKTGDLGKIDRQGRVFVSGRREDALGSGADAIYAGPIESILVKIQGVKQACVVFIKDKIYGAAVTSLTKKPSAEAIKKQANSLLPQQSQIEDFIIWSSPDFPRTAAGKVQKFRVREKIVWKLGI